MEISLTVVHQLAGTDAIPDKPDVFLRQAERCARWVEARGETLLPQTQGIVTLSSFFRTYFRPNCLADVDHNTIVKYEMVVRLWVLLIGDPPLEKITIPMLARVGDRLQGV